MNASEPSYYINGEEPLLAGRRLTAFFVAHCHEGRQITDQVNVAYLCFGEQCYRLYFEGSTVFWRESERPELPENSGLAHGVLLNDLSGMDSVVGQTVERLTYSATAPGDIGVSIAFANGRRLDFVYSSDTDTARLMG